VVLPDVHVAPPAINGGVGPPAIAAEVAFPELPIVMGVAADVWPNVSAPKATAVGVTDKIGAGAGSTMIVIAALVVDTPVSSRAVAEIKCVPGARATAEFVQLIVLPGTLGVAVHTVVVSATITKELAGGPLAVVPVLGNVPDPVIVNVAVPLAVAAIDAPLLCATPP